MENKIKAEAIKKTALECILENLKYIFNNIWEK